MSEQIQKKASNLNKQYYENVVDSVHSIYELTARIDERVQLMNKKQEELEKKIEQFSLVFQKIALLEQKSTNEERLKGLIQDLI